jgi:hypothetical protein
VLKVLKVVDVVSYDVSKELVALFANFLLRFFSLGIVLGDFGALYFFGPLVFGGLA